MRISLRLFITAASALAACLLTIPAYAQGGGTSVVVLDVGKVFKGHAGFENSLQVMKSEVEAFEGVLRKERERIQSMVSELKTYKSGSPEYNGLEAKVAQATSDLQVKTGLKRKEFVQKEAKLYFNTYAEITNAVERFCQQYNVHLVLRFNSEEITAEDPKKILAGVNASIVYHKNRDITNAILDMVNPKTAAGPAIPGQQR